VPADPEGTLERMGDRTGWDDHRDQPGEGG
jgi:hypothetical protein